MGPTGAVDHVHNFSEFAETTARRAPLYAALSRGIAADPALAALLRHAPATQQLPVLLFAVVHHLLLAAPDDELAQWYPSIVDDPRSPTDDALSAAFERFVATHSAAIAELLAARATQTNEVGRCGPLLIALAMLDDEMGPLGHLDIGTSAGLTLLTDHYAYRYRSGDGHASAGVGGPSPVVIDVETTGPAPVPRRLPRVAARLGVDRAPIDVTDPDDARWLEACVWPDQQDRFHRLVAAIELTRTVRPDVIAGDAVDSLAPGIESVGATAHPVVTNSWVLNYLTPRARVAYLAELDRIGATRDISWVYAEAPALIPELPTGPDPTNPHLTVLSLARWRHGHRTVDHLATCHPHGYWLHWR